MSQSVQYSPTVQTMQAAYNGGRTTVVSSDAVRWSDVTVGGTNTVEISKIPSGADAGNALDITTGANLTGAAINIVNAGTGPAIVWDSGQLHGPDGSVGLPTYSFGTDTDTGMYLAGAGILAFAIAGGDNMRIGGQVLILGGTVGSPGLGRITDTNTGIYWTAADTINISTQGIQAIQWNARQQTLLDDGDATFPALTFVSDQNTGLYNISADIVGFTTGGTEAVRWNASQQTLVPDGSAALPSYSYATDLDTGMFLVGAGDLGFSVGGTQRMSLTAVQLTTAVPVSAPGISVTFPTAGNALNVILATDLTNRGLAVTEDNVIRTAAMVSLTRQANATGDVIEVINAGSGHGVNFSHSGSGRAMSTFLSGSLVNQAFGVEETNVIRTTAMMQLTRAALATGHVLQIANNGTGSSIFLTGANPTMRSQATATTGFTGMNMHRSVNTLVASVAYGDTASGTFQNELAIAARLSGVDVVIYGGATVEAIRVIDADVTFAGTVRVPDGSAAIPTYSFTNDPDTGMYNVGANDLGFAINGALGMNLDSTGLTVVGALTVGSLDVDYAGSGDAVNIRLITTDNQAIVVTEDGNARATHLVQLTRLATSSGRVLDITNSGTGNGIFVAQAGAGAASGIRVHAQTGLIQVNLELTEGNAVRTAAMFTATRQALATGVVAQLTNAGSGNTLSISHTGAADAIRIALASSLVNQAFVVSEDNVIRTTNMMDLIRQANATGRVIEIQNGGEGTALHIAQSGDDRGIRVHLQTSLVNTAIGVTENNDIRTTSMVDLARQANATGNVVNIANAGEGHGVNFDQTGLGVSVRVHLSGSLINQAMTVTEGNDIRTTSMVRFTRQANATGHVWQSLNDGDGDTFNVTHNGPGNALTIVLAGSNTAAQAISLGETAIARTLPMMKLTRDLAAVSTGAHVIEVDNNGGGHSVLATVGGGGHAIHTQLDGASTISQAFVAVETAVARTTPMMELTRNAAASGTVINIVNAGSGAAIVWDAGQMFAPDGSAALPAYSFGNDVDAGAYLVSAGTLGWATAGAVRMSLGSTGLFVVADVDAAGGLRRSYVFTTTPVLGTTETATRADSANDDDGWVLCTRAGSTVELGFTGSAATSAGTLVAWVQKSTDGGVTFNDHWGSAGAEVLQLNSTAPTRHDEATQAKDVSTFAAGDILRVLTETDGSWAGGTRLQTFLGIEH